ncbi:MAG TPA: hypothetical protein VFL70_06945 [Bacteroidia bacterium]|nr:hypothetical protein [Bacteroidia bacterium]
MKSKPMSLLHKIIIITTVIFLLQKESKAQYKPDSTKHLSFEYAFAFKKGPSKPSLELVNTWRYQPQAKNLTNSPLMGAIVGFVIGGTYGTLLGVYGKDWVLHNGKVVPKPIHAIVDLFIVAIPVSTIGLIVGARHERSTLEPSKIHVAVGGGWTSAMTYKTMLNAYDISGFPRHIPHWFGYLHYPNGDNSSNPYTWNLSADYNFTNHYSAGIAFNKIVKQEIQGGIDAHVMNDTTREYAIGSAYGLFGDYVVNPIKPENKTRLVFAGGVGFAFHNLRAGGALDGIEYKVQRMTVAPQLRATIDYYSRKNLSLQLKGNYRTKQSVTVPELIVGSRKLVAHRINFRALDITIGVRYHFNNF